MSQARPGWRLTEIHVAGRAAAAAALLAFLIFIPALDGSFLNWDDDVHVTENLRIRSLDTGLIPWAFTTFYLGYWAPLLWLSFAVDYAIWGLNPFGFHLTNNMLHSLNTGLVVWLTYRLMPSAPGTPASFSGATGDGKRLNPNLVAAASGLLFAVHPLHVESVAWITERKDVLYALFYLMSVLFYLKHVESVQGKTLPRQLASRSYLLMFGAFLLSMLSKPMAVTLPAVLLILDGYPLGRLQSLKDLRIRIVEKLPLFLASLFVSGLAFASQDSRQALVPLDQWPLSTRLLIGAKSLIDYITLMFYPVDLSPFHPLPKHVAWASSTYLVPLLIGSGITVLAIGFALRGYRLVLAFWATYVIMLLPVLGTLQVAKADRFFYVPGIPLLMAVGLGFAWSASRFFKDDRRIRTGWLPAVGLSVLIILSILTVRQTGVWKDSLSVWSRVIEHYPGQIYVAHYNRGNEYASQEKLDKAIEDFNEAIKIWPNSSEAYNNRGYAYLLTGRHAQALADLNVAVALNPNYALAYLNRGDVFRLMGEASPARLNYGKACELGLAEGCELLRQTAVKP